MGVYVPFANHLPSSCDFCYISLNSCEARNPYVDGRPNNCPLVELPPHGRLIEEDAFGHEIWLKYCEECESEKDGRYLCGLCPVSDVMEMLKKFSAIIESEGEE